MKKKNIVTIVAVAAMSVSSYIACAQGMAVNTTGAAANSSAILDVSSNTQGVLVPRMAHSVIATISSPATGLLVYQTDATGGGPGFMFYNGSAWVSLSAPTGSASGDLAGSYPNPTIANNATSGNDIVTALGSATSGTIPAARLGTSSGTSTTFLDGSGAFTAPFSLTTTGSSGAATFSGGTLNIPTPSGGSGFVMNGIVPAGAYTASPTYAYATGVTPVINPNGPTLGAAGTPMAASCTLDAIYIYGITTYAGSSNTLYTLTIYKNNSSTSMAVGITFTGSVGTVISGASTTSNPVTFSAGDIIAVGVSNPNPTTGTGGDVHFSLHFH